MNVKTVLHYLWKVPLCGAAFFAGIVIGGAVAAGLGLAAPDLPAGADQETLNQLMLVVSVLMALTVSFVSRYLAGGFWARWLILSFLIWIAHAVNNAIEGAIFTTMSAVSPFTIVLYAFASLTCGAAVAWLFAPAERGERFVVRARAFSARYPAGGWVWRLLAAIAAFPLIYVTFGMLIAPLVNEYYAAGTAELSLPGWSQILPVALLRSVLFLVACLPVLIVWRGSRRRLFVTLGLALFMLVGGLNMLQAYWMPAVLRGVHSVEILADEVLYAGALVLLIGIRSDEG